MDNRTLNALGDMAIQRAIGELRGFLLTIYDEETYKTVKPRIEKAIKLIKGEMDADD